MQKLAEGIRSHWVRLGCWCLTSHRFYNGIRAWTVQIELATDTRSKDGAIVTQVLENANTEAEEDAAINQIAG